MLRLTFGFLFLALFVPAAPSLADNTITPPGIAAGAAPSVSIFAYPGTACPGGSELYKGPEQNLAAASGAVYCRFIRKTVVVSKMNSATCPVGMKPYVDAIATPPADVIWCEKDEKFKIPPMPTQPPKQGRQ